MGYAKYMEDDMEIRADRIDVFAWRLNETEPMSVSANAKYCLSGYSSYGRLSSVAYNIGGTSYERSKKI